jgi:WXG100 family type VII secretion target
MATPRVRANHDALKQIVQKFSQQAEACQRMLQSVRSAKETLEGGDWIGRGATAFYQEMNSDILPALQRLVGALEKSSQTTLTIMQVMMQMEGEVAVLFQANGANSDAALLSKEKQPLIQIFSSQFAGVGLAAGGLASGGGGSGAASAGNATASAGATGTAGVTPANHQVSSHATAIPESEWERQWESVANKKPKFREKYGAEWNGNWIDDTPMQDIRVTKDAQGHVKVLSYKANMAIDSDGDAPASLHLDADHQRGLALGGDHTWVNPVEIPYIAVPPEFTRAAAGNVNAHEGDLVLVRYGDKSVYAIVADVGPNFKAGEASIRTAQELGIDSDPSHGGTSNSHPDVEYIVLPGSGSANNIKNIKPDFDQIQELGQKAFEQAKADGLVD